MSGMGTLRAWDRQEYESPESYSRFLYYRNLGPTRSLRKAYRAYLSAEDGFTGGHKRLHLPGSWRDDSRIHEWPNRAALWDIRNLLSAGNRAIGLYFAAVERYAARTLAAAARYRPGEREWGDVTESVRTLSAILTPEVVHAARQQADAVPGAVPAVAGAGEVE